MIFSWIRCDGVLSMNSLTFSDEIGWIYSLLTIFIIWGVWCFSVLKALRFDLFQFIYILCIEFGNLILISSRGIPCLAMYIDLKRGAHDAEIDDLVGFNICNPFCEDGLDIHWRILVFHLLLPCVVLFLILFLLSYLCVLIEN